MPMIYKRFTEKSAEEWRQIYKALQLMEFLVKNGSERVIDDARSHLSLLKMPANSTTLTRTARTRELMSATEARS